MTQTTKTCEFCGREIDQRGFVQHHRKCRDEHEKKLRESPPTENDVHVLPAPGIAPAILSAPDPAPTHTLEHTTALPSRTTSPTWDGEYI